MSTIETDVRKEDENSATRIIKELGEYVRRLG